MINLASLFPAYVIKAKVHIWLSSFFIRKSRLKIHNW